LVEVESSPAVAISLGEMAEWFFRASAVLTVMIVFFVTAVSFSTVGLACQVDIGGIADFCTSVVKSVDRGLRC
jgi:hypothetical protein